MAQKGNTTRKAVQAKSCLLSRAAHARCLLLTQGLEKLAGHGVQRKKGHRILLISKAEFHGNQEALLFAIPMRRGHLAIMST
jgi:hypothetical protein